MILLALALAAPLQSTWHVDAAGTAPGSGTQADPYVRVDFALGAATTLTGDTVLVAPGVYVDEAIDFLGKDVELRSSGGPSVTTLKAIVDPANSQSVLRLVSGEVNATIEGFRVAGRGGDISTGSDDGGGLYCVNSSVTLRDMRFVSSDDLPALYAVRGGAIYVENGVLDLHDSRIQGAGGLFGTSLGGGVYGVNSTIHIRDTSIDNCFAMLGAGVHARDCAVTATNSTFNGHTGVDSMAGGMALINSVLFMTDCEVSSNRQTGDGAGIWATSNSVLEITGSTFVGNTHNADPYSGSAIYLSSGARATVSASLFSGNRSQWGGAIFGTVDLEGCVFRNNVSRGAGQYSCRGGAVSGDGTIERCLFVNNQAVDTYSRGGGAIYGDFAVDRCTFINNSADNFNGQVVPSATSRATLRNCIVRGGEMPRIAGAGAQASYSNVEGGFVGVGNFDLPESMWPDYTLLPDSPSIDAGDPFASVDPDGTVRDLGAFPFDPLRCRAGCDGPIGSEICTANLNSTGLPAQLSALGQSAAAANLLVLNVTDSPAGSLGFFLGSLTQGNQPLGGGSQGLLCLGGNLLRFSNTVLNDRGTGVVSFRAALDQFPQGTMVQAGETWFMQYWFRDANPQTTSNTSSALSISFL